MSDSVIYYSWKINNLSKSSYFIIFNEFVEQGYLKKISGGALKLYLYFGLDSYYQYGASYMNQSISEIAKYFNKSKRTISYWIKELEELELIKRFSSSLKDHANTKLIPYDLNLNNEFNYKERTYYEWIIEARKNNKLFFPIFRNFKIKGYLREISGEALKLYIFFGIYSRYNTGKSWYSIPTIADFFNRSDRTVSYWIKELKDLKLIYRYQEKINTKSVTCILRY